MLPSTTYYDPVLIFSPSLQESERLEEFVLPTGSPSSWEDLPDLGAFTESPSSPLSPFPPSKDSSPLVPSFQDPFSQQTFQDSSLSVSFHVENTRADNNFHLRKRKTLKLKLSNVPNIFKYFQFLTLPISSSMLPLYEQFLFVRVELRSLDDNVPIPKCCDKCIKDCKKSNALIGALEFAIRVDEEISINGNGIALDFVIACTHYRPKKLLKFCYIVCEAFDARGLCIATGNMAFMSIAGGKGNEQKDIPKFWSLLNKQEHPASFKVFPSELVQNLDQGRKRKRQRTEKIETSGVSFKDEKDERTRIIEYIQGCYKEKVRSCAVRPLSSFDLEWLYSLCAESFGGDIWKFDSTWFCPTFCGISDLNDWWSMKHPDGSGYIIPGFISKQMANEELSKQPPNTGSLVVQIKGQNGLTYDCLLRRQKTICSNSSNFSFDGKDCNLVVHLQKLWEDKKLEKLICCNRKLIGIPTLVDVAFKQASSSLYITATYNIS
eukprot:TRINITY_DN7920_c0_g1_i3.p1 TRINITY_DN7920_c0_g1~~TRINITY_DN7920_c0_g1_i3.p1  ORF type:complete len:492 (-),score=90.57 TRINITY_DN7920_c0_g1_i3:46-1521(-)